jgi:hypothetical protein
MSPTNLFRSRVAIGVWLALALSVVGGSIALGATWSTSVVLFLLCAAPGIAVFVWYGRTSQTAAEVLYAANNPQKERL